MAGLLQLANESSEPEYRLSQDQVRSRHSGVESERQLTCNRGLLPHLSHKEPNNPNSVVSLDLLDKGGKAIDAAHVDEFGTITTVGGKREASEALRIYRKAKTGWIPMEELAI